MPQAVGSLETKGFPPVLAAADAMVKAARVTLVSYVKAGSARFTINIRGDVSEEFAKRYHPGWYKEIVGSSTPRK